MPYDLRGVRGSRLITAFRYHFQAGARRVILMGSDCPGIDMPMVSRAFASLQEHDVVLDPAQDGGYYLIRLQRPEPRLFRGIDWSTDAVFAQTLSQAGRLGLRSTVLPILRDIDTMRMQLPWAFWALQLTNPAVLRAMSASWRARRQL